MRIPDIGQLEQLPIYNDFKRNDSKGYLSSKRGSNSSFLNRRRIDTAIELFTKYLPKDNPTATQVADLACGTGNFGIRILEKGYSVDFYDVEEKFFDYLKLKIESPEDTKRSQCLIANVSEIKTDKKYYGAFLGEAIEHFADPVDAIAHIREILLPGGILCLTTPNGQYMDCKEPNWNEVKDQTERNKSLANTIGNHVCEFTLDELKEVLKANQFGILEHKVVNSKTISKSSFLRRTLPDSLLWALDSKICKDPTQGMIQIMVAQKFR